MKQVKSSATGSRTEDGKSRRAGKRSLYRPEKGAGNYRRAEDGRYAEHPAFIVCKRLRGGVDLMRAVPFRKKNERRLSITVGHLDEVLCKLAEVANGLKSPSDKIRFAEAIAAFFDPSVPDERIRRVCWVVLETRGGGVKLSQAEARHFLKKEGITFSDEQWKRLMKRTGVSKELLTHREKTQGGRLPKV